MKISDKAWTAGIIDGEGSIQISKMSSWTSKEHYTMRVAVTNTDIRMLEKLKELWGGTVNLRKLDRWHKRKTWEWCISCRKALFLLEKIYLYLVTKQKQAEIAIKLQTHIVNRIGMVSCRQPYLTNMEKAIRCRMYYRIKELKI